MTSDFLDKIKEWKAHSISCLELLNSGNRLEWDVDTQDILKLQNNKILQLISAYEKQAEALQEAKKALEFYSCHREATEDPDGIMTDITDLFTDGGDVARKALAKIEKLEGDEKNYE